MTTTSQRPRVRCAATVVVVVCILACLHAGMASAQQQWQASPHWQQPGEPLRGLFGGQAGPASRQVFDLTFSLSGVYIDNLTPYLVPAPVADVAPPIYADSSTFSGANLGLSYSYRWKSASFSAQSGNSVFYYPSSRDFSGVGSWGNVGFSAASGQRFSFSANQSISYSPFYGMNGLFGGNLGGWYNPFALNPFYAASQQPNLQLSSYVTAAYKLTRRTSITAYYTGQHVKFTDSQETSGNQTVGGRISYGLSRDLSVRAGYSRGWGNYGYLSGAPVAQNNIDAGLDYNKSLSRTHRTTFGFRTGAVAYSSSHQTYYNFTAAAHLDTAVSRSWFAAADYWRGLNWYPGFSQPVFSDTVSVSAAGLLGSRLQAQCSAVYSRGTPGFSGGTSNMDTYTGNASLRFAVTRMVGLSANYFRYRFLFSPDYPRPIGTPGTMDRQSAFFGVDLWLPLVR